MESSWIQLSSNPHRPQNSLFRQRQLFAELTAETVRRISRTRAHCDDILLTLLLLFFRHNERFSKLSIVTSFKARNNPVKVYAYKNQLECHDWIDFKRDSSVICRDYDLGLVVSFGHLIPESIIRGFRL